MSVIVNTFRGTGESIPEIPSHRKSDWINFVALRTITFFLQVYVTIMFCFEPYSLHLSSFTWYFHHEKTPILPTRNIIGEKNKGSVFQLIVNIVYLFLFRGDFSVWKLCLTYFGKKAIGTATMDQIHCQYSPAAGTQQGSVTRRCFKENYGSPPLSSRSASIDIF